MKEEITNQKKTIQSQKNNVTSKDKRPLLLFYFTDFEQVFVGWVISFFFFCPWLITNHKHKCNQAKTFQTQVSWSLESCIH